MVGIWEKLVRNSVYHISSTNKTNKSSQTLNFVVIPLLIFLFAMHSSLYASSINEKEILTTLIEAMQKTSSDYGSGRGVAMMVSGENGEEEKKMIEFKFKDRSSRSDIFYEKDGNRDGLEVQYTANPYNSVAYRPKAEDAWVYGEPQLIFYRNKECDLHPETFELVHGYPVHRILSSMLRLEERKSAPITVEMNEENILIAKQTFVENVSGTSTPSKYEHIIKIDTNNGFRLLSYQQFEENLEGIGSKTEKTVRIKWKKYGSKWYIKSAKETRDEIVVLDDKGKCIPSPITVSKFTEINILEYEPNVNIEDIEFTLKGLDPPIETKVTDKILGVMYFYGGPVFEEDFLENTLSEAFGVQARTNKMLKEDKKITQKQKDSLSESNNDGIEDLPKDSSNKNILQVGEIKKSAIEKSKKPPFNKYIIISFALVIILIVLMALLRVTKNNVRKKRAGL